MTGVQSADNATPAATAGPVDQPDSAARGRLASVGNQMRTVSASALGQDRHDLQPLRNAHSTSPTAMGRYIFPPHSDEGSSDAMNTSDDEVDFWGGDSSLARTLQSTGSRGISARANLSGDEYDEDDDYDNDDDDDEDEEEDIVVDEDEDDVEEDDEEDDQMAIFGHR